MTIMLIPTTQHKQENIMRHPMPMRNMILPLLTSALMILAGDHMVFFYDKCGHCHWPCVHLQAVLCQKPHKSLRE